jgi:hypothetical protein
MLNATYVCIENENKVSGIKIMILGKTISPKKLRFCSNYCYLASAQTNATFCKKFDPNISHFFRRKVAKIAENCDRNIGPG